MSDTMTVAEVATLLNATRPYVLKLIADGRRAVDRQAAEAYRAQAQARAREALAELARVSKEAGLYNKRK
jgi:hypothetical protein